MTINALTLASPQPGPQTALISCPIAEIFFGGARFGGKSFGSLLKWAVHSAISPHCSGIIFRKTFPELDEVIKEAKKLYTPLGAQWHVQEKKFIMPNKSELKMRYLDRDDHADHYQGHSYTFIGFDEAGNWAHPGPLDKLRATLRSTKVDPKYYTYLLTANPGGVGHNWLKARYIDPAPPMTIFKDEDGNKKVFIPSLFKDNKIGMKNDPNYLERLKLSGPDWLVKAWIEGDWNIVAGGMFDDVFNLARNVVSPFKIPASWYIDRSFDWGSARPFAVLWWAESDGSPVRLANGEERHFPPKSLFLFSEWYGWNGKENTGLKLLAKDIANGILERESLLKKGLINQEIKPGPADSSIYTKENNMCIADDMENKGIRWVKADKSPGSRVNGWERMREMMKNVSTSPLEEPGFYVFDTCRQFLRTVPTLPRCSKNINDVDTNSEDHIADAVRYRILNKRLKAKKGQLIGF